MKEYWDIATCMRYGCMSGWLNNWNNWCTQTQTQTQTHTFQHAYKNAQLCHRKWLRSILSPFRHQLSTTFPSHLAADACSSTSSPDSSSSRAEVESCQHALTSAFARPPRCSGIEWSIQTKVCGIFFATERDGRQKKKSPPDGNLQFPFHNKPRSRLLLLPTQCMGGA
jgi:hypothetical protein